MRVQYQVIEPSHSNNSTLSFVVLCTPLNSLNLYLTGEKEQEHMIQEDKLKRQVQTTTATTSDSNLKSPVSNQSSDYTIFQQNITVNKLGWPNNAIKV
jgi:hypothetical protein